MKKIPQIIIVGGGAGGLELATALGRRFGKKNKAQITLVDRSLTHIWKPLLHEIAAGTVNVHDEEINYISHAHENYFKFQLGELIGINRQQQTIQLKFQPLNKEAVLQELHYDILILAIGSISNNYNVIGADGFCNYLDSKEEAENFQSYFLNQILGMQQQINPDNKDLDIAIIGGGATGVELAAELRYATQQAATYGLDHLRNEDNIKITIIEAGDSILAMLPKRIIDLTMQELKQRKITVLLKERVTRVTDEGVYTASGKFIPATLKVWAAGIQGADVLTRLDGLEINRNKQLLVNPTLQTTQDAKIFAFGDCAACPMPDGKSFVPARAQSAHQQASLLEKSITKLLSGKKLPKFKYRDYGSLISLSKKGTIGNLMGNLIKSVLLEGALARLFYISLHKLHQAKLLGWWRMWFLTVSHLFSRRTKPRLKLH